MLFRSGMGANYQLAPQIMVEIQSYRRYPNDLFTGADATLEQLRQSLKY